MSIIDDATTRLLERSLDLRSARQDLLAANVANVDPPGYKPVDLAFEGALREAVAMEEGAPVQRTHGRHMDSRGENLPIPETVIVRPDVMDSLDGNAVDLDREMARTADNSTRFRTAVEVTRRRFATLAYVISQAGGR